ncbi:P-loop containing nucleoside triphosphate hydrolase protein [Irpex rosettiformis]|uniref:P-loop containing nucleoside triphosphate hydrolase protein n=1 Tax=Irpex rosettiformis TaxID=378272 RepID=A0ACB8UHK1_9APHY|nr:P-loop containing nucleoside triphosphate hydrolase protein [Irpex rosettiformis]
MDPIITEEAVNHNVPTPEILSQAKVISSQTLLLVSLLLAVLLAVGFFAVRKRSQSKGSSLLLVGPSGGGKTAILSTLVYKRTLRTHSSMQTNMASIALPPSTKSLRIVDVPGHPRIFDQFREYMPDAKAVAFVVDASTISRNGAVVAEHLHRVLHVLISLPPSQSPPAFAIVAHKCDALKASASATAEQLAINRVRTVLERELDKRRTSHAGGVGVESLGGEGDEGTDLGGLECTGNGEFRFAEWEGGEVSFFGTSVAVGKAVPAEDEKGKDGLAPFREWLLEL